MIAFQLSELAAKLHGELAGQDVQISSVSTDTRSLGEGDLYVALSGPRFDGHDFLEAAARQGAAAAMISRHCDVDLPLLQVADTRIGLGQMAAAWRRRSQARVVGVTGSNGKTTVKEMLAAILSRRGKTLATRGNFNNDIGLPLTLCRLQDEDFAVVEMGANHPGEIGYLSRIARPDVAVLNNAGRAHLEGFGDLRGVALAKAEILEGLSDEGVFVFNTDDTHADLWRQLAASHRSLGFGVSADADIRSPEASPDLVWDEQGFHTAFTVQTPSGDLQIHMRLAGEHNRMNALAAIAAAQVLGAGKEDIEQGLASLQPVSGRLCLLTGQKADWIIDDSYNANPDSVTMAMDVLRQAPGRRVLVLGDLGELGEDAARLHAELGEMAAGSNIDLLFTCGSLSEKTSEAFGAGARHFADQDLLIECLLEDLRSGDVVLIKGSRAAAMDRTVEALCAEMPLC
ncbi:UDP-N-acetylmuramoyl-tripeptide--D-alanyl-D-alanine ligase [Thiolapillus sp.]|uniref:UDP-N-acetylmuramoyl-tripeptide--D-alanyl-D- alanine ligase n=1 Tax=Thiolapillus sp. TaxID=2017437 RepID=UPI0026011FC2